MDGFAVRAADTPGELRMTGEVAAGAEHLPIVSAGTALRIMTGAQLPPGADAVVPLESAVERDGVVGVAQAVESGAFVRAAGHDTRRGEEVCLPGPLGPAALAVLASLGVAHVEVRRRPRVAILSTGDELVEPGTRLRPGQIYDANGVALAAAIREAGAEPLVMRRQPDDARLIERTLRDAAASADVVVTSGGVSVGRHDLVRELLDREGEIDFWRIAVQPGKPLAVGSLGGVTVIGLPGNPVSALVTCELFVRRFIRAALGLAGDGRLHELTTVSDRIEKDRDRRAFVRVFVRRDEDGTLRARTAGGQQSSQLRPLAEANALLVVPEGEAAAEAGQTYEAIVIGELS
jgi:molybdopterin molybdotransferase